MVNTALRPAQRIDTAQAPSPPTPAGTIRKPFTAAEEEKLRQLYPAALWSEILEAVPDRTQQSILSWASQHSIKRELKRGKGGVHRPWSPEEEAILRQRYAADGPQALAERFSRTSQSIKTRASVLGIGLRAKPRSAQRGKAVAQQEKPGSVPATPVLNANAKAKAKKEAQPSAIAKMLEQMRNLPAGHPRRLAYMLAARNGNGQDAYQAWLNWKPQPQAA